MNKWFFQERQTRQYFSLRFFLYWGGGTSDGLVYMELKDARSPKIRADFLKTLHTQSLRAKNADILLGI